MMAKKTINENEKKTNKKASSWFKLWIIALLVVLTPAIILARFSLIQLNFEKPIKANYIELPPFQPLVGNLAPNTKLENAKYLGLTKLRGPEAIEIAPDGSIYTGLMNGQIVRVHKNGEVEKITQSGDETNETLCNDYGPSFHMHRECGRPLGLRLRENFLYVADAFYGVIKVNVQNGEKKVIISSLDKRFGKAKMLLTNDLDVDGDLIYFVDTSYERDANEALEEFVEALPRGRLFSYNEKTDKLELLLENLNYPNGLQLLPNKDAILINECTMARILKFYLKGEKKGNKEVFANLPGHGDTLRLTDRNTILSPFASVRYTKYASILDLLGKFPFFRSLIANVLNIRQALLYAPKYGLVVEYDLNGKPLRSWHDPSGKMIEFTTSAAIYDNKLYMGSFFHDFIGFVDY